MTYSFREQAQLVRQIRLSEGEKKTLDCPFCGGSRKFSITKLDGRVLWNCFRASCGAKGSLQGPRSVDAIKSRLEGRTEPVVAAPRTTPLPRITSSILNHPAALDYVIDNNCMDAYNSGYINIRYAPAEKRVLFYTNDGKGAVGRSLVGHKAKWWTYGDVSGGYQIGTGTTAVIVEDVPSACSAARLEGVVGVPLLGTNATNFSLNGSYSRKIIILDSDASSKAVSLAKCIGGSSTIRLTKSDIKHLEQKVILSLLELEAEEPL